MKRSKELESPSNKATIDSDTQAHKKPRSTEQGGAASPIDHSSGDESKSSSNPSMIASTNQQLILTVNEVTDGEGHKNVMLSLSNVRPDTQLWAEQGDHVTAYVNFLQILVANTERMELQKAAEHVINTALALFPDIQ